MKKTIFLKARIKVSEQAYDRYRLGILTPLERHLRCDSEKLAHDWSETLKIKERT